MANSPPASDKPPRFGFEAIRVPLYASAGRRMAVAETVMAWWRSTLSSGAQVPAWIDVQSGETAPYALSAGGMAVLARAMGTAQPDVLAQDYYSAILQLLSVGLDCAASVANVELPETTARDDVRQLTYCSLIRNSGTVLPKLRHWRHTRLNKIVIFINISGI